MAIEPCLSDLPKHRLGRRVHPMIGSTLGLVMLCSLLIGCGSVPPIETGNILEDIKNPEIAVSTRLRLIEQIPGVVSTGEINHNAAVKELKDIVWMRHLPYSMRVAALDNLIGLAGLLTDQQGIVIVRSLLPTEKNAVVRHRISELVVIRDWVEVTPALVRSFAIIDKTISDESRPEHLALLELHPELSIEQIVFETFISQGKSNASRLRRDSWNLLSRLDESGELRVDLLAGLLDQPPAEDDHTLVALRRGLLELRTIPLTGEELEWLTQLQRGESGPTQQWWRDAAAAVASLDANQRRGLRVRHIESLRWAARNRTGWMQASKAELDAELSSRLASRPHTRRLGDFIRRRSESLDAWRLTMAWADFLTALVIDDAISTDRVRAALFAQAETDRQDTTTEYGGIVRISIRNGENDIYVAADYPPKPIMRESDTSFIASPEMFRESATAMAHYHFHAQKESNGRYAGPSFGDLIYAARYGRACIVFTSINADTLAVDLYQPDGVIIDLGEITRPTPGS